MAYTRGYGGIGIRAGFDFCVYSIMIVHMKTCITCGKERPNGRKMCPECFTTYKRQYANERYKTYGRHVYKRTCPICNIDFNAWRSSTTYCASCIKLKPSHGSEYEYSEVGLGRLVWKHRVICETLLNRILLPEEHIHHIDGNGKNNELTNLIVLSNSDHGRLHQFLESQYRTMLSKDSIENIENCWNSLIVPMTTTWLETANVKVIKIWEIGQSAAELVLVDNTKQEGSETMHDTPDHLVEGDDIVQTTTERAGEIPE